MVIDYILNTKKQDRTSGRDSYCAGHCLHIIYLTKVVGIDFKFGVLYLWYQTIS